VVRGTHAVPTQDLEILRNILSGNNVGNLYHMTTWEESQLKLADNNLFQHDGGVYNVGFGYTRDYETTGMPGSTESLAQWRAGHGRKHDQRSVAADPRFVNADSRDFRLRPDSPAYALGFEDIDFASIGLTVDFPFADPEEALGQILVAGSQSGASP